MTWDECLDKHQRQAAEHVGKHARLLAGPGTGKTRVLTRRIVKLISVDGVGPEQIMALVFTRVNMYDLRKKLEERLPALNEESRREMVKTLHSYALTQLLKNSHHLTSLPQPVRIADNYEEKEIICRDLSEMLELRNRKAVKRKFDEMAADWQSLAAEKADYVSPDPCFLGAWEEHRDIYGYTLRSELAWQLKRAVEENPAFGLDVPSYLFVDEYQDLNRCDLDIIAEIVRRRAELYCAGDDDQSIYGFRLAHPDGIRNFPDEYDPVELLQLQTCWRCDRRIIELATFVMKTDYQRLPKPLEPTDDAGEGEAILLRFDDQAQEAEGVAVLCQHLTSPHQGYLPGDILVLLRSDHQSRYSKDLVENLARCGLGANVKAGSHTPLDDDGGRYLLSLIRLRVNSKDDLAWRTLLEIVRKNNQIGAKTIAQM